MSESLEILLKVSVALFMVGNLLDMGLVVKVRDAVTGLQNSRFVIPSILFGFVVCPGIAWLLGFLIPMAPPFVIGLVLLGMAPCAPFLPMVTERAHGDMGYTAALMLLVSLLTVIYMPLAVPFMVDGLTADAWTIAKPLLLVVLLPLAIGLLIQNASKPVASRLHPMVKKGTGGVTILMLVLCVIVYGEGFLEAIGTYAIGAQLLFYILVTAASYGLSFGLPREQKSVLTLGMCTRNLGAAFAPLFAVASVDERAIIMVALGVPLQVICAFLVATWLGRTTDEKAVP